VTTHIKTYDQVGIKEDVSDIISNISPMTTPAQSAMGTRKVNNTLFQWQEDELRAVAANAAVEGADASDADVAMTTMRSNYTQIFTETVKTSGTADVVSTYGRAKESAYQLTKAAKQVKRDLEHAIVGVDNAAVAGNSSTAREFASFSNLVHADHINYTGAGPAAFSETFLLAGLQELYNAGADPKRIDVTPSNSLLVADFAKASGRYRTIDNGSSKDNAIINVVNLYVSPFGEQRVVLNRFQLAGDTYLWNPEDWKKAVLRNWTRETLAKTGDAMRQMIVGEFSIQNANFKDALVIREGTE
jgi:hypothetical protein